jgi:D-xylose 1-dehydrogenase (NADP+, D-xylono-1,5-lactone-forming)
MEQDVRWGVVGCAGIARKAMIPALQSAKGAKLYALASRSQAKVDEYAQMFPCEKRYTDYDALLQDPNVDAVYIPLPNSLHCQWVVKALEAGKPVLCEKPLALNAGEVRRIAEVSERTGVPVMEAFAYLHDPVTARFHELIRSGVLGKLRYLEANFCYLLEDVSNVRLARNLGGGVTYDLGCYPISFFRTLTGAEPVDISLAGRMGSKSGVDEDVLLRMRFPDDVVATSYFSFQSYWNTYNIVVGERGFVQANSLFDRGEEKELIIDTETTGRVTEKLYAGARYSLQVEQMNRVIREGQKPAVSLDFSLGNAVVIDRILTECGYNR